MTGLLDAAQRVAAEVLAPAAEATDAADTIPAAHLAALAHAGLFAVYGPGGAEPAEARRIHEALGGACGATYFVWAQHQGPVLLTAATPNAALRERELDRLRSGEVLGGTAFAHLRRPGPPAVLATPRPGGGWRLDGSAPWATSWGLAGVYTVAAVTEGGDVLWSLVPGEAGDGLTPSPPLALAVMQATSTVRLDFDGYVVPAERVLLEVDQATWWAIDDAIAARLNPAALGVAATALAHLAALATPGAAEAAAALGAELQRCREGNEALAAAADAGSVDLEALAAGRAEGVALALRCASALLLATGGRGIERSSPAQRLVREAAFYGVQAQTAAGRAASLRRLS